MPNYVEKPSQMMKICTTNKHVNSQSAVTTKTTNGTNVGVGHDHGTYSTKTSCHLLKVIVLSLMISAMILLT